MSKKNNMALWDAVCETNPDHTKQIKLGRTITAIDPYRQIEAATRQFGPAGEGWGWDVENVLFLPTNEVGVVVKVWHGDNKKTISQFGQASLYIDKAEQKKDTDCMKKAVTDGLTKCLSCLGFNADIFLGKFDDNKYVQEMAEKHHKLKGPLQRTALSQQVRNYQTAFMKAVSLDEFLQITDDYKAVTDQAKQEMPELLTHSPEEGSPTLSHLYIKKKGELELVEQQRKELEAPE